MHLLKGISLLMFMGTFLLAFTGCEEELSTRDLVYTDQNDPDPRFEPLTEKSIRPSEGTGSLKNPEGGNSTPYPTIIEQTFIPSDPSLSGSKCLAWKITWPDYAAGMDPDLIPSIFETRKGTLNSIHYLTSGKKDKAYLNFSLYLDDKLESANNIGALWPWPEDVGGEATYLGKIDKSVEVIEYWVKEHPSLFEYNWDHVESITAEIEYQAGDFFIYSIPDLYLFGGIRIVSMEPRIIEVYLTVPNI